MFISLFAAIPLWPVLTAGAEMMVAAAMGRGYTGSGFSIAAVPLLGPVAMPARIVPIVPLLRLAVSADGLRPQGDRASGRTGKHMAVDLTRRASGEDSIRMKRNVGRLGRR